MDYQSSIFSYLLHQSIPMSMINILENQRVTNKDLQIMDRDDVEHLFKNEYGFTFADRKRFWNTIQKLRSPNRKCQIICIGEKEDDDGIPDVYEAVNTKPPTYSVSIAPSASCKEDSDDEFNIAENSSSNLVDTPNTSITSLSTAASNNPTDYKFQYPVELPQFSAKVTKALEYNTIQDEWDTFMKELVCWILNKKKDFLIKAEYQAIGQTIYKCYPSIGKDGYRPWSYFCRILTDKLRKERRRRGYPCTKSWKPLST
ncbi:unnamed protein product [Adineta ricciae]|uniref:Uncharacterized protein n=1 Tax=Adineta ricciae TaxID=249248 RepID=A0A815WGB8_ADIRI|nr:unnamed protein product [Adineta ricciae]CAF1541614.1 unnamed protein product [Adineta ricciae]